jgi:vitellogenic carboxypeptidase-like protein
VLTKQDLRRQDQPTAGVLILATYPTLPQAQWRRINLSGVAIGNGLVHLVAQVATHVSGSTSERPRRTQSKMNTDKLEYSGFGAA